MSNQLSNCPECGATQVRTGPECWLCGGRLDDQRIRQFLNDIGAPPQFVKQEAGSFWLVLLPVVMVTLIGLAISLIVNRIFDPVLITFVVVAFVISATVVFHQVASGNASTSSIRMAAKNALLTGLGAIGVIVLGLCALILLCTVCIGAIVIAS